MKHRLLIIFTIIAIISVSLMFIACDSSSKSLLSISVSDYSETVSVGESLPKVTVTAYYTDGSSSLVSASYAAVNNRTGNAAQNMIASEKGTYTITATYTEGSLSQSASYQVKAIGDPTLSIQSVTEIDELYDADTLPSGITASAVYEDENGNETTVNSLSVSITDSSGSVVSDGSTLYSGSYTASVSYNGITAEKSFTVSAGLSPVSFSISTTIPEKFNKETDSLDLSSMTVTVTYSDGSKTGTKDLTIFNSGSLISGVTVTLGDTQVTTLSSIDFSSYSKGTTVSLKISIDKSLAKTIKVKNGTAEYTTVTEEGTLENTYEILVVVNPTITDAKITVYNESGSAYTAVPYVKGDQITASNISFTYDDGTGAASASVNGDSAISVTSTTLLKGDNIISFSYGGATSSVTVNAVDIAIAKEITEISESFFEDNMIKIQDSGTTVSLPSSMKVKITYEDNCTEIVDLADSAYIDKVTLTLTKDGSSDITITNSSSASFTVDNVGSYTLTVTYSSPSDFTHRQESSITSSGVTSISCTGSVTIKRSAVISDVSVTSYEASQENAYNALCEGDSVRPADVSFTFINATGESSAKKASDSGFTLLVSEGSGDYQSVSTSYTLPSTSTSVKFKIYYAMNDTDDENYTSLEYTLSSWDALLSPVGVSVSNKTDLEKTINIDTSNLVGETYSVESIGVTLTYSDGVTVAGYSALSNNDFTIKVGDTAYGSYKYSYDSLGSVTVTVALSNSSSDTYKKRPTSSTLSTTGSLSDTYTITLQRNPIISAASYTGSGTLYERTTLSASDFSFTYINETGSATNYSGTSASITINSSSSLTLPEDNSSVTVALTYSGVSYSFTITGIEADKPKSIVYNTGSVNTAYRATSPSFTSTVSAFTVTYYSGVSETSGTLSYQDASGNALSAITSDTTAYVYFTSSDSKYTGLVDNISLKYYTISSLTAAESGSAMAIVYGSASLKGSDYISGFTLTYSDSTSETLAADSSYLTYSSSYTSATALRTIVAVTPYVTINGETVSASSFSVQVVANSFELASYKTDAVTISANSSASFTFPSAFNSVSGDSNAVVFSGYYNESTGEEITYSTSGVYYKTEGTESGTLGNKVFTVTNTIVNSTSSEVTLHPILTTDSLSSSYSYCVLGVPSATSDIGTFANNSNIKIVVFEQNATITELKANAFQAVPLRYISVPASVKTIGSACFADGTTATTDEPAYIEFESGSALETIDTYVFSKSYFANIFIPKSVTKIYGFALAGIPNLKSLIIEDGRSAELILNDVLGKADSTVSSGSVDLYVPSNVTLTSSTFTDFPANSITIAGRKSECSFSDNYPFGASNDIVSWAINDSGIATSDYPSELLVGQTFTATVTITPYNDSNEAQSAVTYSNVSFTVPSDTSTGESVTFTCDYTYGNESLTASFTAKIVDSSSAVQITSAETLSSFLSGSSKTGYVSSSFSTEGFTISSEKTLVGADGVTITLTSAASSSDCLVLINSSNVSISNITFAPGSDLRSSDTDIYIMGTPDNSTKLSSISLSYVTLDGATNNYVNGDGYFRDITGSSFTNSTFSGGNLSSMPLVFDGSTVTLEGCTFGQNSGSNYYYSRLGLIGDANYITITNTNINWDMWCAENTNNSSSNLIIDSSCTGNIYCSASNQSVKEGYTSYKLSSSQS